MMLTVKQIMDECDALLPNGFDAAQKVSWLNQINREFFESVKVPKTESFPYGSYVDFYVLSDGVRRRNINLVQFGSLYESESKPGRNVWVFDDTTRELQLIPPPLTEGIGFVHYYQVATTTFTIGGMDTQNPDAAAEYHTAYIFGLCERIAKANEDVIRANNFAKEYQNALNVAAQNYGGGQRAN